MHLQKLEIQGFKSFAQKTTFIFSKGDEHSKGVTAVIGPNGSGKSNVADAIRWVLGEQSMKLLRSKKSEDVIFFGSDTKARLGFCEVSLHFDNSDKTFPLEYGEVVIARRLYRDGEAEYSINKNKVRLADVALLLAQAHFAQKSYSVIGQGMIDSIINAPPHERKEYFDEAAGVRQYQIKKDQSQLKLKSTKENLAQVQVHLAELAPKIKFFERQQKRFEERAGIHEQFLASARRYYNALWNDFAAALKNFAHDSAALQEKIDRARASHTTLQKEFSTREASRSSNAAPSYAKLVQRVDELVRKKQAFLSRMSVLESRLQQELERSGKADVAFLVARTQELRDEVKNLQAERTTVASDRTRMQEEEQLLRTKLSESTQEFTVLDAALRAAAQNTKTLTLDDVSRELGELSAIKHRLEDQSLTIEEIRACIAVFTAHLEEIIKKIQRSTQKESLPASPIQEKMKELATAKEVLLGQLHDVSVQCGVIADRANRTAHALEKQEKELARLERELAYFSSEDPKSIHESLSKERNELTKNLETTEQELAVFQTELDSLYSKEKEVSSLLLELQKRMGVQQQLIEELQHEQNRGALECARAQTHQEELLKKIFEDFSVEGPLRERISANPEAVYTGLHFKKDSENDSRDGMHAEMVRLKTKLDHIGAIDTDALAEFESAKEEYDFLSHQVADLAAAILSLEKTIVELEDIMEKKFDVALSAINKKFHEYFTRLFNGGSARLVVLRHEEEVPEEADGEPQEDEEKEPARGIAGVEIHATPPGKKLKNMQVLSGGEKAMTAIALLCAILSENPAPFVVLDEVDAALDDSNATRFAGILEELAQKTQFIVITHNKVTIHTASVFYGVTMGDEGISRVLSLDMAKLSAIVAQ